MDALQTMMTRRSTRRFKQRMPDDADLRTIIEAGRRAPSGGNSRTTRFIVIRERAVLTKLSDLARAAFARMAVTPETYVSLAASIKASKRGDYVFHYNAPVLVVTANKTGYGNALADCACAAENMMLAANALDLGSCYINQLRWLAEELRLRAVLTELGMAADEQVFASVALGFADTADGLPVRTLPPDKGNPVIWH
jgi:nitroreductase